MSVARWQRAWSRALTRRNFVNRNPIESSVCRITGLALVLNETGNGLSRHRVRAAGKWAFFSRGPGGYLMIRTPGRELWQQRGPDGAVFATSCYDVNGLAIGNDGSYFLAGDAQGPTSGFFDSTLLMQFLP
jgi:hypothetical protein